MSNLSNLPRGRRLMLAGVSTLAIGLAYFGAGPSIYAFADAPATATATVAAPLGAPASFADIVAAAKPAVVTVTNEMAAEALPQDGGGQTMPPEEFFRRFFGQNGQIPGLPGMPGQNGAPQQPPQGGGMALGSGFIVSADGYLVTNAHVVENARKLTVTLDDGRELAATLVGTDAKNDIAVLKITDKTPFPVVQWGNSDPLRAGDPVLAIGDPFGIGTTVTSGIVSARGRDLHNGPYDDFIQIDAAINHGNSGGPLLDVNGKVVGINTAIFSPNGGSVGVGFAIPSAQAEQVVAAIISKGSIEHGFIGVSIQELDDSIAQAIGLKDTKGALVAAVSDGSPAAKGGVRAGDVIIAVNDKPVETPRAVSRAIADLAPGADAKLALWREGKEVTVTFAVGKFGGDQMALADTPADPSAGVKVDELGIEVANLDPQTAQSLGLSPEAKGAVVTRVDQAGEAAAKGLREGDVIVSVNQSDVGDAADVTKLISAAKEMHRQAALLLIERGGNRSFVAIPFKAA
jgi:serine protease Do